MKNKPQFLALVLVCAIATGCIGYAILHNRCSTAHLARHIHVGMSYNRVAELLGEPNWLTSSKTLAQFDLDDGQSLIVTFYQDNGGNDSAVVHSCHVSGKLHDEIWLFCDIFVGVCFVGAGAVLVFLCLRKKQ